MDQDSQDSGENPLENNFSVMLTPFLLWSGLRVIHPFSLKNEGLRHTAAARVNGPKVAKFLDR